MHRSCRRFALALCLFTLSLLAIAPAIIRAEDPPALKKFVRTNDAGQLVVTLVKADKSLLNPWPAELEAEFQKRADYVIRGQSVKAMGGGNTYFESEKRTYGVLMTQILGGRAATAIPAIQSEDAQAKEWHGKTQGIDLYPSFTLKHQTRKYFYFGPLLDPKYKQRMFDAAKTWSEVDPLRRPHASFKPGKQGWGPDAMNSWVDIRSTENLFLMRATSVYLFAEETGNEATRAKYKQQLVTYVKSLYRIGMGEWESENYHGHSIAPLVNLHDFAKDREVKALAKAALDYVCISGAVKYFHGGFNGPTKRDYNHPQPFGGSGANMLWMYYGDCPLQNQHFESDEVHLITSSYRPPMAAVNLARKQFRKPAEIFASKTSIEGPQVGDYKSPPQYHETQYIGQTFQMGSLIEGTSAGAGDVNGFKIMMQNKSRGADAVQCVCGPDPEYAGSPKYANGKVSAINRVAQHKNIAIWLVKDGKSPWVWTMPNSVKVETKDGITFLQGEQTWISLHPLNISQPKLDGQLTKKLAGDKPDGDGSTKRSEWHDYHVVSAQGQGGAYCGFAIEIGEPGTHKDFATFQKRVIAESKIDKAQLERGVVEFIGSIDSAKPSAGKPYAGGKRAVKLAFADRATASQVWRDGAPHDWAEHSHWLLRDADTENGLIQAAWLGGTLSVNAGDQKFTCTVTDEGKVTFKND